MADLPEISQNLDEPLPQVDPNSALVPYRMARTDPGGQPVVTTGYGPRARPPVQPPEGFGGGAGMPNLDQIYQAAFSKLPVNEAVKAVEAATRYVAQRGYQRDLQSGADPIKTFAKYAPLMFRQATGIPEAFEAQTQQARMNAPTIHPAAGGLYRIPRTGPAETLVPPKAIAPKIHYNTSTGEIVQETGDPNQPTKVVREGRVKPEKVATITVPLNPDNPDGAKITGPANDPDVQDAVKRHEESLKPKPVPPKKGLLEKAKELVVGTKPETPKEPAKITTKEQYDSLKSGDVYVGKDGKKYRKP